MKYKLCYNVEKFFEYSTPLHIFPSELGISKVLCGRSLSLAYEALENEQGDIELEDSEVLEQENICKNCLKVLKKRL